MITATKMKLANETSSIADAAQRGIGELKQLPTKGLSKRSAKLIANAIAQLDFISRKATGLNESITT